MKEVSSLAELLSEDLEEYNEMYSDFYETREDKEEKYYFPYY